ALNAESVVALSPQWSIDPGEVGHFDRLREQYYDPALRNGRKITADEVAGKIYTVFDPLLEMDVIHARKIRELPGVEWVYAPFAEHMTIHQLSETMRLPELFRLGAREALSANTIRQIFRTTREGYVNYGLARIRRLLDRSVARGKLSPFLVRELGRNAGA